MEEQNSSHIDYDLLARVLSKEATDEEQRNVQEWLNRSQDNRDVFASMKMLWQESESTHFETSDDFDPDTDLAWSKVNERIQPRSKVRSISRWIRVAASIITVAGAVLLWNFLNRSPEMQMVEVTSEKQEIQLADGSLIEARKGAEIKYPKSFNDDIRKVELKGQAFFKVEDDADKPFIVEAGAIDVRVVGTEFDVNASSADSTVVFVESGKVEVSHAGTTISLLPGETGIYRAASDMLFKVEKANVVDHFWRKRKLNFNKAPLTDVLATISKAYNVQLRLTDKKYADRLITVRFDDQELASVLDIVTMTLNLRYEQQSESEFIIYSNED